MSKKKRKRFNTKDAPVLSKTMAYAIYLCLGLTIALAWLYTQNTIEKVAQKRLDNQSVLFIENIENRIFRIKDSLLFTRSHFLNDHSITSEDFNSFIYQTKLTKAFPSVQSFGYLKFYTDSKIKNQLVNSKRAEGLSDYKVWPETKEKLKSVVLHNQPLNWKNRQMLGFNSLSDPVKAEALLHAIEGNQTTLTKVYSFEDENLMTLYIPHYVQPYLSGKVDDSHKNLSGAFFAVINVNELIENTIEAISYVSSEVAFIIEDYDPDNDTRTTFYSKEDGNTNNYSNLKVNKQIDLFNVSWTIQATPRYKFLSIYEKFAPTGTLLVTFFISFLIIFFIHYSQRFIQKESKLASEARRLAKTANSANEAKTRFLANMSHEIRTPLGAILGYSELLLDEEIPLFKKHEMLDNIRKNGDSLTKLLSDILDTAKIEAGKIDIEPIPTSIEQLMNELASDLNVSAVEKNIYLKFTKLDEFDKNVYLDKYRFKQIITNLVNNAIRFTDHGGITVRYGINKREGEKDFVYVEVEDTGSGIPKRKQSLLFKAFSQADSSYTRRHGGTGIGLHLSKNLALKMNGDLKLMKSKVNKGSTFRFEVPLEEVPKHMTANKEQKKKKDYDLSGTKILLVEDSPENQNIFKIFLTQAKASVDICDNGKDAIVKGQDPTYDLILMDIQIPEVNGHDVTAKLRKLDVKKPIIAITAHAHKEEVAMCFKVGCSDHLAKPFSKNQLLEKVDYFTRQ